jgi:hypothetical protein
MLIFPRRILLVVFVLAVLSLLTACGGGYGSGTMGGPPPPPPPASDNPFWAQWGASPQHGGNVVVAGQSFTRQLADIVYDPFVAQEQAEQRGDLVAHYPATLIDGSDFYIEMKSGTYVSCPSPGSWSTGTACGPNTWDRMIWNVARFQWQNNQAVKIWQFTSDWKPELNGLGLGGWEPVFHPALANSAIYVPGAGGTVWKVDKTTGKSIAHIDPFAGAAVDHKNTFVSSPLTVDTNGNIFYNVIELTDPTVADPWRGADVVSSWLVKITPQGTASTVTYATLVPGAPPGSSNNCPGRFSAADPLPWPPSLAAVPATRPCGSQRPGVNVAPAIATDGTVYTVSRAHFDSLVGYLVAVNPDLSPKWQASLQRRLTDGCGVLVPIASDTTTPNSCRPGATVGVDPTTNDFGSGLVSDQASSSPTVLPGDSILFGAIASYNGGRGHMFKFDATGAYVGAFDFGWDSTPAVYPHGGTYSIIIKDNFYPARGLYCSFADPLCQPLPNGPFYITQLDANLNIEWRFKSTTVDAQHPDGYEWCINAPAVDSAGVVYVNSEDGNLYSLPQGNVGIFTTWKEKRFLKLAIGAAYTPLSLGPDGKIYTQNDGHLFVVGN